MFELFDQFLYLSIFLFGAYVTLYVKSRSYSGLLLIVCSVLSNFLLFKIVLDPFIFIALPITAVLLLNDFVGEYKLGYVERKHKIGASIAVAIIIYDAIFLLKIFNLHLIDSYNMFAFGSILGVLAGFYLVIYPFKEMVETRSENLELIKHGVDPKTLTSEERLKLVYEVKANNQDLVIKDENKLKISDSETSDVSNQSTAEAEDADNLYTKILAGDKLNLLVGAVALLVIVLILGINLFSRTVIDIKDYVFVTVDPDVIANSPVSYYASFEHFDENNFYDDLIASGRDYGLSDKEIEKYTPVYTPEAKEMFKKLDFKVALDRETVNNGDVVTTNVTYDYKYANRNNIVVKNTNFETTISNLPERISNPSNKQTLEAYDLAQAKLEAEGYLEKYELESVEPTLTVGDGDYLTVVAEYQRPALLGREKTIKFELTPYLQDGQMIISDTIIKD